MADLRNYRHTKTGLLRVYPQRMAAVFSDVLKEVEPGAKPLAYVPIPAEARPTDILKIYVLSENASGCYIDDVQAEWMKPKTSW